MPAKTDNTQSKTWDSGLSAKAIKAVEGKFVLANRHVAAGEASLLRAGRELRIVLRTYLKGDKAAFTLAAAAKFNRGPSIAYEYVQAADAFATFSTKVKATGTNVDTIGVRTWAKLDRFTNDAEAVAEGAKVIKAEAARAKAEGTKAFTNEGLAASIKKVQGGPAESTGTDDERKVQRVATKYRDSMRDVIRVAEAGAQEKGFRAAAISLLKKGAEWGAISGSLTPLALQALMIEWLSEEKAAADEAKKIEAKAAAMLAEREAQAAAAATLKPEAKPEAKVAEAKPQASAKRTNRKPRNTGSGALVKNAPGAEAVKSSGQAGKPELVKK